MQQNPGTLYVIAAPSGGGKTSLVNALIKALPDLTVSISHTTRRPRPNEKNGVNYHFVDQPTFDEMVKQGQFLEYAHVFAADYGTSKQAVQTELDQGQDVILEIDWQGAEQIRALHSETISIYILPPSRAELRARLTQRGEDSPAVVQARMDKAVAEIRHCVDFDYWVINDDFDTALADLRTIISANRLKIRVQAHKQADLVAKLCQIA